MRFVFPALFPFTVLINCLRKLSGPQRKSGSLGLPALFGLFLTCASAGAPSGSIMFSGIKNERNEREASDNVSSSILSAFMNFSGPAFLIGTVGSRMLGFTSFRELALLVASHYLTGFLLCALYRFFSRTIMKRDIGLAAVIGEEKNDRNSDPRNRKRISAVLPESIYEASLMMLKIGGTIVFCSVIIGFILDSGLLNGFPTGMRAFVPGLFEITSGISLLSRLAMPLRLKTALISFLISFGGISIMLQVFSISKTKAFVYFVSKLVFGIFSAAVCYLIFPLFIQESVSVIAGKDQHLDVFRAVTSGEIAIIGTVAASAAALSAVYISRKTRI